MLGPARNAMRSGRQLAAAKLWIHPGANALNVASKELAGGFFILVVRNTEIVISGILIFLFGYASN